MGCAGVVEGFGVFFCLRHFWRWEWRGGVSGVGWVGDGVEESVGGRLEWMGEGEGECWRLKGLCRMMSCMGTWATGVIVGIGMLVARRAGWREACEGLCWMLEDIKSRYTCHVVTMGMSDFLVLFKLYCQRSIHHSDS